MESCHMSEKETNSQTTNLGREHGSGRSVRTSLEFIITTSTAPDRQLRGHTLQNDDEKDQSSQKQCPTVVSDADVYETGTTESNNQPDHVRNAGGVRLDQCKVNLPDPRLPTSIPVFLRHNATPSNSNSNEMSPKWSKKSSATNEVQQMEQMRTNDSLHSPPQWRVWPWLSKFSTIRQTLCVLLHELNGPPVPMSA
jgi:hypothetical protein